MRSRRLLKLLIPLLLLVLLVPTVLADTYYTIQQGDTLYSIARRFGISLTDLAQANNIINPNLIYAGQTLTIPDGTTPSPNPTPVPTSAPPVPMPPIAETTYVVQPGDTLYRIALQFGVSVQALAQANGLSNVNFIYVGQVLTIPGGNPVPVPPIAPTPIPPTPVNPIEPPPVNPIEPTAVPPVTSGNLFPNPSFEDGWYNRDGISELQLPNQWSFEWDENVLSAAGTPYLRPETRVLSSAFLPDSERPLFIYDGTYTVKIFKGYGAISFRLFTDVTLTPGTYQITANIFPDLVHTYENGRKVWAPDPTAGDVRFIVGSGGSGWFHPAIGQKNSMTHTFAINSTQTVRVGVAMRGKYALINNGWFMDDWKLQRVGN